MRIDLTDHIFNIKSIENHKEYFPDHIKAYLDAYSDFLKTNRVNPNIINKVDNFATNIYMCLLEYYCGQHYNAKCHFDNAANSLNFEDICRDLDECVFYRARNHTKSRLTADQMFHIPFEDRRLVSTQRFSYPGLPCLYLGSSYEVCCEEVDAWKNKTNIAVIEKETAKKINVLDLYFFEKFDFEALSQDDFERFLQFWPIVACCSFVYNCSGKMQFRPDYIIPQLLLEYLIDNNADNEIDCVGEKVYGIRYHCAKRQLFSDDNVERLYINYVFPALSNEKTGYCKQLTEFFSVKRVCFLKELKKLKKNETAP